MAVHGILNGIHQTFNMPKPKIMPERIRWDYGVCRIQFRLGTGDKRKNRMHGNDKIKKGL
jgi:hypothetical protein